MPNKSTYCETKPVDKNTEGWAIFFDDGLINVVLSYINICSNRASLFHISMISHF